MYLLMGCLLHVALSVDVSKMSSNRDKHVFK